MIQKNIGGTMFRRSLGSMSKEQAITEYHKELGQIRDALPSADPTPTASRDSTPPLTEYMETVYLPFALEQVSFRTLDHEQRCCGWLSKFFGDNKPIGEITAADIQAYVSWRRVHAGGRGKAKRKTVKSRTIILDLHVLRKALNHACDLEIIPTVPRFKMPRVRREEKPQHRWLTREQMEKVLANARTHELLLTMAFLTGMRKGELLTREWSDIDLDRGEHGVIRVTHKPQYRFWVKIGKERVIPLCPRLRQLLLEVPEEERRGLLFMYAGDRVRDYKCALRRACERAGVPVINPHATRKTFASLAMMDGMDIPTLSEIGGWSDTRVLLEIYAHVTSEHAQKAMASISFGQVKEPAAGWVSSPAAAGPRIPAMPGTPTFTGAPTSPAPSPTCL